MKKIDLMVDGTNVSVEPGTTILKAAAAAGIEIPHLCYDPRVEPIGSCRLCVVRIAGQARLATACNTPVTEGMQVTTADQEISTLRKNILELILSDHCPACTSCDREGSCKIQDYAYKYRADERKFAPLKHNFTRANYTRNNAGILYDSGKCIKCGLCIKFCEEVQMAEALTFAGQNGQLEVTTALAADLHKSSCELCGGCIRVCPAGAMLDRAAVGQGREKELDRTRTTCPYCGVGCQLDLLHDRKKNKIVRITASPDVPVSQGNLCVKGHFGFEFVSSSERLTYPLIRNGIDFQRVSWDEAIAKASQGLAAIRDQYGPDGLAFLSSCRCTNEENYLMQKLARLAGRTNNIDQCATTCHAPTVAGLAAAFGSGAMTNSIGEIRNVQTLFLIGANPTEAHPIVGLEMKRALRQGARLIVCDPRETWMARRADIHIKHRPGTDNMLINAMMNHLCRHDLFDRKFIAERCENFETFRENLKEYPAERAAEVCGVETELIRKAAEMYAAGTPSAIFYTLGITEHTCGTENVMNLANLAMLCGQIGKESSGVNPLRGQNNVQGACDMGAIHALLPGYQKITDPAVREKFARTWGGSLPANTGGRVTDFIEQAGAGVLKGLYCMGEDPARSEPNSAQVVKNLQQLEFIVCQDIFMSATAKLAHVILPAVCSAEKDGTFTNTERRVQRVRKAVDPPGEARPDWQILCDISTSMGYRMAYRHPGEIWDELAGLTPIFAGISYERITPVGLQWPCPTRDHQGTRFLHKDRFTRGKGRFHAITSRPPAEEPDEQYPLVLSTGRTLYNYNVGNMSRKSAVIQQKEPANFIEIHGDDAAALGIHDGDLVKVKTRRGSVVVQAHVGRKVRPGTLWMPFHFTETATNLLTNDAFDTITRTGEYKVCAARIERVFN